MGRSARQRRGAGFLDLTLPKLKMNKSWAGAGEGGKRTPGRGGGAGLARGPGAWVPLRAPGSRRPGARYRPRWESARRAGSAAPWRPCPAEQRSGVCFVTFGSCVRQAGSRARDAVLSRHPGPGAGASGFPKFADSLWGRAHPQALVRRFGCCHWDPEAEAELLF